MNSRIPINKIKEKKVIVDEFKLFLNDAKKLAENLLENNDFIKY